MARPEVSGKKRASPDQFQLGAYTIHAFCLAHGISLAMYFKMKAQGLGPDEMELGRKKAISVEAAARWRVQREKAARESSKSRQENAAVA
jgi:hypothetical protein